MKKKICIIGSGHGGGYLAYQLSKLDQYNIILLDLDGYKEKFNPKRNIFKGNFHNNSLYVNNIKRAYGLGGGNNVWHGLLTKLEKDDLIKIDKITNSDLINTFDNYYNDAANLMEIDLNEKKYFDNYFNDDLTLIFKKNLYKLKNYIVLNNPKILRKKLIEVINEKKIKYINNSLALYLENSLKNNKTDKLTYLQNGETFVIDADYFVLSCGAIETPRIIQQSINDKKITNFKNNNIGKFLTDHPFSIIGYIKRTDNKYLNFDIFEKDISHICKHRKGFLIKEELKNHDFLQHSITLKYNLINNYELLKDEISDKWANGFNNFVIFIVKSLFDYRYYFFLFNFLYKKLNIFFFKSKYAEVYCHLDQRFIKESEVIINANKDNNNKNYLDIKFNKTDKEIESLKFVQKKLKMIFHNEKYIFIDTPHNKLTLHHGNHHSGTMKMGKSINDGVVDKNLKMFGFTNLYVCDSSIFPNFGNSNPVLAILAFSSRLCNHFKKMHK